jgi:glycosyltransferase involved in cell wall biosynthesis
MTDRLLRVCLISEDLSLPLDEGFKKFVHALIAPLAERTHLLVLTARLAGPVPPRVQSARANRLLLGRDLQRAIRRFRPEVLIYLPKAAATLNTFLRCGILRGYAPEASLFMVALQPRSYGRVARHLIPWLRPDMTLVQDLNTLDSLQALGCPASLLPSGIDLSTFHPVTEATKTALREKYGLSPEAFVVLHAGHQKRTRNVLLLNRIHSELGCETVVVASTSTDVEGDVAEALRRGGTRVIHRYVAHIAELYQLADCYLFPVHLPTAAVNMPLSVLEAMACGLPVVTTPFGTLPLWFSERPGFVYAATDDGLVAAVARLYQTRDKVSPERMRAQVEPFSWAAVAEVLLAYARSTMRESGRDLVDQKTPQRGTEDVDPACPDCRGPRGEER